MTRASSLFSLLLSGCVCQPTEPCTTATEEVDGGVHWFMLPVHPNTGAIELVNLDNRDGLLLPVAPGPVSFSIEGECGRQRWTANATDTPFAFRPTALSFPVTRPGARAALPITAENQTDDTILLELRVPLGFRTEPSSPIHLEARESRLLVIYFEPPSVASFDGNLVGVAFSQAQQAVALHGVGGGPVVNVPSDFDAGVVAAMGPQQRPDGRWLRIANDAPLGEDTHSDLLLPPTGTSDCAGVQALVEEPRLLRPGSSTRMLLLIPTDRLGQFDCSVTIASTPGPFTVRAVWRTMNLPPCDVANWPLSPVGADAGFAAIELVTGLEGCLLTYSRLEPADAGVVLSQWSELDVPPQSRVTIEVFVSQAAELRVNVSDPAIRTLRVSIVP